MYGYCGCYVCVNVLLFVLSMSTFFLVSASVLYMHMIYHVYMYNTCIYLCICTKFPGQPKTSEQLHRAIQRGDIEIIQSILEARYGYN